MWCGIGYPSVSTGTSCAAHLRKPCPCRPSLWVHTGISPAVLRNPRFLGILHLLWLFDAFCSKYFYFFLRKLNFLNDLKLEVNYTQQVIKEATPFYSTQKNFGITISCLFWNFSFWLSVKRQRHQGQIQFLPYVSFPTITLIIKQFQN